MSLSKIQFAPGIQKETTNYTASGGWFACDKVRFRQGMPEKIGGWLQLVSQQFLGACRYIHQWSSYEGDQQYIGMGTSAKLYILWGQSYYDITPLRLTISPIPNSAPICVLGSANQMALNVPATGAQIGDYFTISGATAFDVFTAAQLNQQFQVIGYYNSNPDVLVFQAPAPTPTTDINCGGNANGTMSLAFDISAGLQDASVGQGWGIPPWGGWSPTFGPAPAPSPPATGWGAAFDPRTLNPVDPTTNQMRLWSLDNFGEDLVACIRGGPIYYWHEDGGVNSRATPLSEPVNVAGVAFTPVNVPGSALQVLVSPNDRHLIAFGCPDIGNQGDPMDNGQVNPLLIRWADTENAYDWFPTRTNTAGSQPLSAGSYIICALRTVSGQILIWTDLGLWLQQYIGTPYIFGFQPVAQGLSIVGPNAMVNAAGNVYWMDHGVFMVYSGGVQEVPCSVKDYVFSNINYTQAYKIYCGHNHAFHEVTWFYPSANSIENDSYVTFNYVDQVWTVGMMQRTAWLEMGRGNYPVATDLDNHLIYSHEYGSDANGKPLPAYIESADIDLNGGDSKLYMQRFIPDVFFRGDAGTQQTLQVTIQGRNEPLQPKKTWAELTVTPMTRQQFIRVRDRQVSFRFSSQGLGVGWRLGTIRADWQQDGRR